MTTETREGVAGRDEQVDNLLHDAEHAAGGAEFAEFFRKDSAGARLLRLKRDRLIREALAIDPRREAPAWEEVPALDRRARELAPSLAALAAAGPRDGEG